MSTRGCIARLTGKAPIRFEGVYHHWDSYPSGLGRMLYTLWNQDFQRDTQAMLRELIDVHGAGWSTIIGGRFNGGQNDTDKSKAPSCYCHGGRNERKWKVTERNASSSGIEYVYAFDGCTMIVLGSYIEDGQKMIGMFGCGDPDASWRILAEINLLGREPDWEALDQGILIYPVQMKQRVKKRR